MPCSSSRTGAPSSGESYGAIGTTIAEVVFATGMTGYQETLTDPSYRGQIVVMTAPHIGNTGVNDEDFESRRVWVDGYVVRDPARVSSSWRSQRSLDDLLTEQRRRRHQRHRHPGTDAPPARARRHACRGELGVRSTSTTCWHASTPHRRWPGPTSSPTSPRTETYVVPAIGDKRFTVAAIDLGIKGMTPRRMAERGIEVHVLPATSSLDDVLAVEPDGVFMSNGPGDPATADHVVEVLQGVLGRKIPYFGICLGNQIFGRALGRGTYKLVYGHRGINQPVQDRTTGKVEVTAHNHGFAVDAPLDEHLRHTLRHRLASPTSASTTTSSKGWPCSSSRRSASSTTPRPRPARTTPPTSSTASSTSWLRRLDQRGGACPSATTSSRCWSSGPGRSSSARPASSTTPAPRPAGCCARRASAWCWSTPTRRRS